MLEEGGATKDIKHSCEHGGPSRASHALSSPRLSRRPVNHEQRTSSGGDNMLATIVQFREQTLARSHLAEGQSWCPRVTEKLETFSDVMRL